MEKFDLIIVGGGSAATSAAIRANEIGLKTLLVNDGLPIGGTCVNVGCVPSKFLIRAAESFHRATVSNFPGIITKKPAVDFKVVIENKNKLVAELQQRKYVNVLQTLEKVKNLKGFAELIDKKTVLVNKKNEYSAEKIIIATGATTHIPPINGLKESGYLTNATLFDLEEKPESLTILGAGYIGMEIASAYVQFGTKIRIIEFTDRVLRSSQTPDVSAEIEKHLSQEGIEFFPNHKVDGVQKRGSELMLQGRNIKTGESFQFLEPGHILVATGTVPNTGSLGCEKIGLTLAPSGHVQVNEKMETNIPTIYAVGDAANTPPYVYTAAYEGKIAVENAFSSANRQADYSVLPWVIFTDPQVAGVGIDEVVAEQKGIPNEVSLLPMSEVPRCIAALDTRGFIKLIRNPETDELLGARIVAPEGGELVMELALAMRYKIKVKEVSEMLHPYLTLSEAVKMAALTFNKKMSALSCCAT